ncbi:RNA-binding protein [Patescibacteria group bacterium]|nr:RNA-binding protein [Patescibacteria group bacterium]
MAKNLFIGNISYQSSDDSLAQAFGQYGTVVSAKIIKDKFSGRSRGFGFVEMETEEQAKAAIQGLNDQALDGRNISVREANPRSSDSESSRSAPAFSAPQDDFGPAPTASTDDSQQLDEEVKATPEVEEINKDIPTEEEPTEEV